MIPPAAQRQTAQRAGAQIVEVPGSHAVYVSQATAVARLIEQAAAGEGRSNRCRPAAGARG
jgi:hypothetical protein